MTVFDLKKGDEAYITDINLTGSAAARLGALGLKRGAKVLVAGFSLFKSAALIGAGAARIGIRRPLAEKIEVERAGDGGK